MKSRVSVLPLLASSFAVALSLATNPAQAQTFPNKPIRMLVAFAAGGFSDVEARRTAEGLQKQLNNNPVIIENRPGAGGNIGMDAVAKAPGDGHTLLMSYVGSHAINPSIYSKLPFDPEADFVAVATLANVPFVAAVNASVPVTSMKGLVAYAAQRPVAFGSAGNGSVNHLLGEMFNTASGAKMQHVPYKGAAPALTDLISGHIQVVFTSLPSIAQHIRAGTVKGLGVTGSKRAVAFKDISTISESGFPGFVINPWFGLFASKGTPANVAKQINADVKKVLEEKDVLDKFAALGAEPFETTPQEFQAILSSDIKTWAAVVKSSGATAD